MDIGVLVRILIPKKKGVEFEQKAKKAVCWC